jgi:hypothetical protein
MFNGGVFLWGIGNAIAPSIRELIRLVSRPVVIFSPIRSKPRRVDVAPDGIVIWKSGKALDGRPFELPTGSTVTSRVKSAINQHKHYALVCASSSRLRVNAEAENLELGKLRNLLTNRPVGSSQVTAVVRLASRAKLYSRLLYPAALQAELVFPYFVELTNPIRKKSLK